MGAAGEQSWEPEGGGSGLSQLLPQVQFPECPMCPAQEAQAEGCPQGPAGRGLLSL